MIIIIIINFYFKSITRYLSYKKLKAPLLDYLCMDAFDIPVLSSSYDLVRVLCDFPSYYMQVVRTYSYFVDHVRMSDTIEKLQQYAKGLLYY